MSWLFPMNGDALTTPARSLRRAFEAAFTLRNRQIDLLLLDLPMEKPEQAVVGQRIRSIGVSDRAANAPPSVPS